MHKYDFSINFLLRFRTISRHKLLVSKYDIHQLHFSIWWYILQGQWLMFISSLRFSRVAWGLLMSICDYMRLEMEDEVWKWSDLWESHSQQKINIAFLEILFLSASARYRFPSPLCVDCFVCLALMKICDIYHCLIIYVRRTALQSWKNNSNQLQHD